jgi:hypothetical protein
VKTGDAIELKSRLHYKLLSARQESPPLLFETKDIPVGAILKIYVKTI